jgi:NAD(P)-dependent dehydrogenase (short-subunit alcohol dehydrogenase family)
LIRAVREVDILISNAGPTETNSLFEIADDDWEWFVCVYLLPPVRLARHFARRMVDRGWGRVLFNAHVVSGGATGRDGSLETVKAGLPGLSRAWPRVWRRAVSR